MVVGLTGGIASGKSTVARMLRELGTAVVDADVLAREVVEPGSPALDDIVTHFGKDVLRADGRLDRERLGAVVFADERARAALNAITHPRIAALAAERTAEHFASGAAFVVYEAALLVENGLHQVLAALVVVWVPPDVQLARLIARDGLEEGAARARIASQLSLDDKRRVATHVIDNSGSLEDTRRQVVALHGLLAAMALSERA
jgi:dephospho-CoA kinase